MNSKVDLSRIERDLTRIRKDVQSIKSFMTLIQGKVNHIIQKLGA